jgi:hypothetical protein
MWRQLVRMLSVGAIDVNAFGGWPERGPRGALVIKAT